MFKPGDQSPGVTLITPDAVTAVENPATKQPEKTQRPDRGSDGHCLQHCPGPDQFGLIAGHGVPHFDNVLASSGAPDVENDFGLQRTADHGGGISR